jgi:hypothetical protein
MRCIARDKGAQPPYSHFTREDMHMLKTKKKTAPVEVPKETAGGLPTVPKKKRSGRLQMKMGMSNGRDEWIISASSTIDALKQGKILAVTNGFKWPQDVIIWDKL